MTSKTPGGYKLTVFLSNKDWANWFGHTYLKLEAPNQKPVFLDTGLTNEHYDAIRNNPEQALKGEINAQFKAYISENAPKCAQDITDVAVELTEQEYKNALQKAKEWNERTDTWCSKTNCTTPVVDVAIASGNDRLKQMFSSGGNYFRTPSGTLTRAALSNVKRCVIM